MSELINAHCSICGSGYHLCMTCDDTKTYTPWRSIVDTVEHYKVFLIIRDYENSYIDKAEAKKQLQKSNLDGLENFITEIKIKIDEILLEDSTKSSDVVNDKTAKKLKKNNE